MEEGHELAFTLNMCILEQSEEEGIVPLPPSPEPNATNPNAAEDEEWEDIDETEEIGGE